MRRRLCAAAIRARLRWKQVSVLCYSQLTVLSSFLLWTSETPFWWSREGETVNMWQSRRFRWAVRDDFDNPMEDYAVTPYALWLIRR